MRQNDALGPSTVTPQGATAAHTPRPVSNRRLNRVAVASFAVSLLWLYALGSLLGLILGMIALRRIDTRTERGHGLAVAGIIVGAVGIVVTAIAVMILSSGDDGATF